LLLYIYHAVIPAKTQMESREEVLSYLKKQYPQGVLSGETENNLEEIIVDLFEHEFLENHDKVRKELQDYRGDTLNDTSIVTSKL